MTDIITTDDRRRVAANLYQELTEIVDRLQEIGTQGKTTLYPVDLIAAGAFAEIESDARRLGHHLETIGRRLERLDRTVADMADVR